MLDERGKNLSTNQLLLEFKKGADLCNNKIDILIGGADGFLHDYFNEELGNKQILKISFGSITLPHMLARIILIEQIYRIETIIKNHPYHRN
jgi:23S rRNA (pseudouridine1915-N3)-methyltransferase